MCEMVACVSCKTVVWSGSTSTGMKATPGQQQRQQRQQLHHKEGSTQPCLGHFPGLKHMLV
jgi:hypothetical protein